MKKYFFLVIMIIAGPFMLTSCGGSTTSDSEPTVERVTPVVEPERADADKVTELAPTGFGSVKGQVIFRGTRIEPTKLEMAADPTCAAAAGTKYTEDFIVSSNNEVKNSFVYIKSGTGLVGKSFPTPKEPATLDQKGCVYEPHVLGVQVNQPINILNSDATLHNVHALPTKSSEFNLGMPIKGMKLTKKFSKPEVMVKFKCDVHPWMSAYVGVVPHPFYAVTNDKGEFEIKDLPAGQYMLEAWHEKLGTRSKQIKIADGEETPMVFTFTN